MVLRDFLVLLGSDALLALATLTAFRFKDVPA